MSNPDVWLVCTGALEPGQGCCAGGHDRHAQRRAKPNVAPSRKNRKSITTWQDEAALKELRAISAEAGISQQELIAEGLNYVLTKYRKRTVAR